MHHLACICGTAYVQEHFKNQSQWGDHTFRETETNAAGKFQPGTRSADGGNMLKYFWNEC